MAADPIDFLMIVEGEDDQSSFVSNTQIQRNPLY